jgi:hypothetical protein
MHAMQDNDSHSIQYSGKTYIYDAERDIFYSSESQDGWDTYGWLAVLCILAGLGLYLEFFLVR